MMPGRDIRELADAIRSDALAAGADDAECFVRRSVSMRLEVQDGKVAGVRRGNDLAAAVRVLAGGRPGFSYATDPEKDSIRGMIDDALQSAKLVAPSDENIFSPADVPGTVEGLVDQAGLDVELDEKVRLTLAQEETALAHDERVTQVHRPAYSESFRTTGIASGGFAWSYDDSAFSMSTQAVAGDASGSQTGYDWAVTRRFSDLDPETIAITAARDAVDLLGGEPPETGTYVTLLTPRVAIDILGVLTSSFSADEMQKGRSRLAERAGEKVFSSQLSIVDDGSLAYGIGSAPFDDERVPPVTRSLVEDGVVSGKLHTLKTAAREGQPPTGNASKGDVSASPAATGTNLYVKPGPGPLDMHLAGKTVMKITSMMGIHTADRIAGDFSVGAAGFLIEDGQVVRPFRNGTVSGNIFELLADVVAIGDDLVYYGSTGSPSILVAGTVVSGN
jgi:PmbA protein